MRIKGDDELSGSKKDASIWIKKIISELKDGCDIEGAVLVEGENEIIACDLPRGERMESELGKILSLLKEGDGYTLKEQEKTMFSQRILDYKGCKILAKKLRDKLTLLVMLHRRGYISLAMLEMENTIRKIDEILMGSNYQKTST